MFDMAADRQVSRENEGDLVDIHPMPIESRQRPLNFFG
jgi:hypothetical protein